MRKYHLSYDTIDCDRHFQGNYAAAKNHILCVLAQTPIIGIHSFNESSLILDYEDEQPRLFNYLQNNLGGYFYFTISLVARSANGRQIIHNNPNTLLNIRLQVLWRGLNCSNQLLQSITPY